VPPYTELFSPVLPGIRAPKTAELIAARLRGQIVRGELRAGSRLPPEAELQESFGVSRPTLREAFRILEAESLLSVRRGARGGAQVVVPDLSIAARHVGTLLQISGTTIGEVYEARLAIEPAAARMLALRRRREAVTRLRDYVGMLQTMATDGAPVQDWARATSGFHDLVVELAGNKALAVAAGVLREVAATHVAVAFVRTYERPGLPASMTKAVRSYGKLVDLVEARDGDGAEKHWRTHLQVAGKVLFGAEAAAGVLDLYEKPARS
jgi:DNA-binding FadR family transcriptional regulator